MSKKKLLNESTIRRFGGLAGIKPATTSNFLSEMGEIPYERDDEDDDMMQEMGMDKAYERDDEEELDAEVEVEEEPVEDEPPMEEPAAEGGEADELVMSLLSKVSEWAADHGVEMDVDEEGEGGEEMEMDLGDEGEGGEEMEMDLGDEGEGGEEMEMEMGEEETLEEMINSILSEEEEEEEEPAKTESIKIVDDNEIIQEVAKRVKQRLARIAKSQRKNK